MNGKKIVGNGSKATLPGGKKMEDFKKSPQIKNNNNSLSNNIGNGNNNDGDKEKPKSKGEQLAQNVGSEAMKKSLKAAFPYIPQFIINRLVDSKLGQKVIENTLNRTKRKLILILFGVVSSLLMSLLMLLLLYAIFAGPIMLVGEFVGKIARDAGLWFKSFGNFMIGNGWCHDEESCNSSSESTYYKELNFYTEQYKDQCGISMNGELITATIFYDRMVRTDEVNSADNNNREVAEKVNEQTGFYKYSEKDVEEIQNLTEVYKNRASAVSCPLAGAEDFKGIIDDLKKVLGDYGYDASDLDFFLSKYKDKISNNLIDVKDFYDSFSAVTDENRSIFDEFLSKVKGVGSCFNYAFESLKGLFGVGINECAFDSDNYKNYLMNYYIPNHYIYLTKDNYNMTLEEIADEIILLGEMGGSGSDGFGGACSGSCSYVVNDKSVNNIKVRLVQGTDMNYGEPIPGEELVDFEKYILGVVYAEIGNTDLDAYAKTQAIAARNYALTREMGNKVGLRQEDGQWILYIRNSTEDQVYCDPDKGCSKISGVNSTTFSDPSKYNFYKGPLPGDSPLRTYVSEVIGKIGLSSDGSIVHTSYVDSTQQKWASLAKQGHDYTEILRQTYGNISTIEDGNCSSVCTGASGPYTEWKQRNWPNVYIGTKTIAQVGCLVTSVSMQIARSGVATPLGENFNPGTLVENYRRQLFTGNLWRWAAIQTVVPDFVYTPMYNHSGMAYLSDDRQIQLIQDGISNGCYYIAEVKTYRGGEHYVAVDYIKDGKVYMMDPASKCNVVNECKASEGYKYRINNIYCYRVKR